VKPRFCSVDVVDECVLKCRMCYKWKDTRKYAAAPLPEDWFRFIDSLALLCGNEKPEIVLAGGETFLYKPIFDIIRHAKGKGFSTAIASSAFMMTRSLADRLSDAGLTNITFSLDSLNSQTHDFLRGRAGVFDAVMKAIDLFHGKKINVCISTIMMNINMDEIWRIAQWAHQNEKIQAIIFLVPMQPNTEKPDERWHTKKEYEFLWPGDPRKASEILDKIAALRRQDERLGKKSKICTSYSQIEAFKRYIAEPAVFVKETECPMTRGLHVSSVGDLFFCYSHPPIGNIKRDLIHKIWNADATETIRSGIRACEKNCHFLLNCFFD